MGLYDYLRELDPETNGGNPDWNRMNLGSRCSGLEAVGWGLIYYDIPKAVVPIFPYFISPSSGAHDLQQGPLLKDRTWSLRRAMARNLNDHFCREWAYTVKDDDAMPTRPDDPKVHHSDVKAAQAAAPDSAQQLSLQASAVNGESPLPAFTMNTTTVEGGDRFLLANYFIKRSNSKSPLVSKPAYSFLDLYGALPAGGGKGGLVDLPLTTAAQMSATFPYVSSAATLKPALAPDGVHFGRTGATTTTMAPLRPSSFSVTRWMNRSCWVGTRCAFCWLKSATAQMPTGTRRRSPRRARARHGTS